MTRQEYIDGLDRVEQEVADRVIDPDTAYRRRLGLIRDLYVSEGGTPEGFLELLTQAEQYR